MSDQMIRVNVNGEEYQTSADQNVLQFLKAEDVDVPAICFHESLGPIESCDTCIVEVNGELQRACGMKIETDMEINTQHEDVHKAQDYAMDKILHKHELYCTVCDYNNGRCDIHNTVAEMQKEHQNIPFQSKGYDIDDTGSFYRYDPNQCILCGRCVEVCQDVEVNETLTIDWEREQPRVLWDNDVPIDESSCVNCGQCVTVCPCNALMEKSMIKEAGYLSNVEQGTLRSMIDFTKNVESGFGPLFAISDTEAEMREDRIRKTKTVCTYCGVGCSFDVWTKDRHILKIQPQPEAPANGISTCVKGKFGWDYVNSEERLTKPLIREGDTFKEVEWDKAISHIAKRLKEIHAESGPEALGFIASSKATNEESYLMQKLARQIFGTNNVDNCSRYCQSPATKGLFRTVGYGGDAGSLKDIETASLVITIGSNTAESHPVLASKIKRSQKLFGQKMIVADIREHEMAERADMFIQPKPGSDLVWLSAVTNYIVEQGWHDKEFLKSRVINVEEYLEKIQKFTLDYAEKETGLSKQMMIKIAEAIHESDSTVICWAMGVTQQKGGSDTSTAISNLLIVTGNYGRHGTGAYPLRGHNNVQGCSDFGSMPNTFSGYQDVQDDEIRKKFEEAWDVNLNGEPGLTNHGMVDAIHDGTLRALYLQGEDMGIVDANANYVQRGFEKLDFFVVQDLFLSRTSEFADVILPAVPSLEKEGTFTNTERRIQRIYPALPTLGDSKPDWEITQMLANELGAGWEYEGPAQVMDEIAKLTPMFAGVSYERMEGYKSLIWPVDEEGIDMPMLYEEKFHFDDGRARLYFVDWTEPTGTDEEYDLHVNSGRLLEHFHEGNMTYKSHGITRKTPHAFIEVSHELAEDRGLKDGSMVRLTSRTGSVKGRVVVTERVKGKELYIPLNDNGDLAVNKLTSSEVDKDTDTPAYKDTAVKMELLDFEGERPLPHNNHRFGNRQPQIGIKVEEKWKRDDYVFPGNVVRKKEVK